MGRSRPNGPMVPITDEDIENLKAVKEASVTFVGMSKWTGFSVYALREWMKGEFEEREWRQSCQTRLAKVAKDLDPMPVEQEPVIQVPAFEATLLSDLAIVIADKVEDISCEARALRLALDLKKLGL